MDHSNMSVLTLHSTRRCRKASASLRAVEAAFFSEDSQTKSIAVIGKFKIKLTLGQDALHEEPE